MMLDFVNCPDAHFYDILPITAEYVGYIMLPIQHNMYDLYITHFHIEQNGESSTCRPTIAGALSESTG